MTIELDLIGRYQTGIFDEGAAEIPAYDSETQRLFVANGADKTVDVLDLNDPTNPSFLFAIDVTPYGAGANSVAVKNEVVAAAIENDNSTEPGQVVFFDTDGNLLNQVTVGVLPDMLTFTPDGQKILVANEGEPDEDTGVDPEGSISIIDLANGIDSATVTPVTFTAFNGQEEALRSRGVRIFPDQTFAEDAEPEYIAVSSDSKTAFVTLQENNAVAVIDLETAEVSEIQPLGVKDYSKGLPQLTQYPWDLSEEVLGTTPAGQEILLGGLSGLFFEKEEDGKLHFITTPDRGPNGEPTDVDGDGLNERPFPLPDYQARLIRFTLDRETGEIEITDKIFLTREDGETPITGLPNLQAGEPGTAYTDEEPVDLLGNPLDNDHLGADIESIVVAPDGTFWLSDEYRPAIYHFDADGVLIDRFIPEGTAKAAGEPQGTFGTETLPEVYAQRRSNRGFEGMALDTDKGKLYAFIQSPIDNPDVSNAEAEELGESSDFNSRNSQVLRILEIDPSNGKPTGEYVYFLEGSAGVDKIGDVVYAGDRKFYVIERDSSTDPDAKKFIFEVDLTGATNILGTELSTATDENALESMTADDLTEMGIEAVTKTKVLNLPSIGYRAGDKTEGLALLPDGSLAVLNDNDFGLLDEEIPVDGSVPFNPDPVQTVLGIIEFDQSNQLDASDEDGGINLQNHPVFGLYQPDSIATFEVDGQTYYITANEGDARDEDESIEDLTLDPTAFPNAEELQQAENIGRLEASTIDGDLDGDGDYDQLFVYGGRSFSIWDSSGNLVFDSGDEFAQITAEQVPDLFNSDGTVDSFDSRSDNKGAEPEGVVVGEIDGRTYAFIGLERVSGVMVYDVSDPANAQFVQYLNPLNAETGDAADIGPEGLTFIAAEESPNGEPLLVAANEISGTTTIYQVDIENPSQDNPSTDMPNQDNNSTFTLQLLHAADQEAGIPALDNRPNFSAVLNALKEEDADGDGNLDYPNTLVLSSGDAYIPSPFFSASEAVYGAPGRGDILIQNELGFSAIAFGNHEFDFGTGTVTDLIQPDEEAGYPGTAFPYLSSNLDFSTDEDLAPLVVEDGQEASTIPNSIAGNTIVTVNDEKIGVVGATTPTLPSISSPGDVTVNPLEFDSSNPEDVAALAAEIQASVDQLLADNPDINKVVLLAHMQQISIEQQLAELLTDVDIIVAGGSNTLLADDTDRLRAGDEVEGTYPILSTAADGNPIAVVNTDGNYEYVGRLVVDFDENGVIIPESIDPNISGAYATDEEGVAAVNGTPDPEIVEITDQLGGAIAEQEGNIFASTDVFINGERGDVRTQETNLGNLTADANLALAQEFDEDVVISIKNGGGIRDSIGEVIAPPGATNPEDLQRVPPQANELAGKEEGDISQLDIANSLRFNNGLTLLTLTAAELLEVIEHGVAATEAGATPGQFPQVAGVNFSFDADLPAGDRVQSLAVEDGEGNIIDTVVEDGELVGDPNRTFRIVTLNFLADGGDDYPFPDRDRVDLVTEDEENPTPDSRTGEATFAPDGSEQDALAEFLAANFSDENPFNLEDTPPEEDTRIQNLDFREDTVLENTDGGDSSNGDDNGDGSSNEGVAIYDIQGEGHISPFEGETVTTTGIVTAVDSNGFYLQDATGDGNDNTADGIFVFTNSEPTVTIGDEVEVEGTVSEFQPGDPEDNNLTITQISGNPTITILSSGNDLPEAVILGADGRVPPTQVIDNDNFENFDPEEDGIDFYETVEGMRVTVKDAVAVSPSNRFGEIFTVVDTGDGLNATGLSDRGTLNISPDDFNPERIQIDDDSTLSPESTPEVNVGDKLGDVTGVVSYSFGNYEVLATEAYTSTSGNLEPESSDLTSSDNQLTVASYNVLNLDPNDSDGDEDIADGRFDAIATHIVHNLNLPDIIGLQEIQDNDGSVDSEITAADETLQLLVDEIEAESGVRYEFIDNPFIGDDTNGGQPGGNIRTAFLYNPNRVDLVEGSVQTVTDPEAQQTNEDNPFFNSRLPLAATFTFNGQEITVVDNHFSSKGGSSPLFGQIQPATELQEDPTVNGSLDERQAQAQAVKDFVDNILASDSHANVVALGDFNEFEFISPLETLEESLTNLTETLPEDERYSFIFQGNSQVLDHILVSDNLAGDAQFDEVHVNSEFAETSQRASDHDPLLASFKFPTLIEGTAKRDKLTGTDSDDIIIGLQGRDRLTSNSGKDKFVYTNIADGGDIITDFEVGKDVLDLGGVLDGLDYSGENPLADGVVQLRPVGSNSFVQIDPDGFEGDAKARSFLLVQDVNAVELNNANNFKF